jgi:transcriptional regulator with XRE-family HTH domain
MNPIRALRINIFGLSQQGMAAVAGVDQATVSRWESGRWFPPSNRCFRIRAAALERGLPWDDRWFFEAAPIRSAAIRRGASRKRRAA